MEDLLYAPAACICCSDDDVIGEWFGVKPSEPPAGFQPWMCLFFDVPGVWIKVMDGLCMCLPWFLRFRFFFPPETWRPDVSGQSGPLRGSHRRPSVQGLQDPLWVITADLADSPVDISAELLLSPLLLGSPSRLRNASLMATAEKLSQAQVRCKRARPHFLRTLSTNTRQKSDQHPSS